MIDKDEKIILSGEQESALGVMMSGANMFLTGEAGTGKSTLAREFLGAAIENAWYSHRPESQR